MTSILKHSYRLKNAQSMILKKISHLSTVTALGILLSACSTTQFAPVSSRQPAYGSSYPNNTTTNPVYYPNASYPNPATATNPTYPSYIPPNNFPPTQTTIPNTSYPSYVPPPPIVTTYPVDNRPIYPPIGNNVPSYTPSAPILPNTPPSIGQANEPVPAGYHRAMPGDTIYKISRQYNIPVKDLLTWNNLENPNQLNIYQLVKISPLYGNVPSVPKPNTPATSPAVTPTPTVNPNQNTAPIASTSMIWPVNGARVLKKFDQRGIEIGGRAGDPVVAANKGKVIFADTMRGYGKLVVLNHGGQIVTAYANLQHIAVKDQQEVKQGQVLGILSNAGKMQFQVRKNSDPVDPLAYLTQK